ncbi:hypothetical protein L1987_81162 [Smallanthus sonchifolius]|uniref:Uncharacterized protein n=1 Tax=Smallanthus sonchifolius TaxID=185202 RepID=A0ACB8YQX6_9ASTR|nr:hypothetical protein L1987_81162 [Smallanthus sonchifolius]
MEAFSLLRYWRSNAGDATSNADVETSTATTIVTAVSSQTSETEDGEDDEDDHGPFFDLMFSLPAEGDEDELVKNGETENSIDYCEEEEDEEEEDSDGSDELKFTLLSGSSGDSTADVNVSVSPSDDLFFKGGFVSVDQTVEINSKPLQSRVSLMKSATKFRVMMLKFKKSKSNSNAESSGATESNASSSSNSKEEQKNDESEDSGKSPAVKLEDLPIVSLFKRHNSSKAPKKKQNENESVSASSEEKKFSKGAMQKYLRKVKPLYIRVSKRYAEKLKFTGQAPSPAREEQKQSPATNPRREKESISEVSEPPLLPSNVKALKQGNLPAGLRVVCKHLRNSRSTFTAVAAAPPGAISSKRRDDSLLQQQDGIQSAILHCKRSFKASRDSDCSSNDPAAASGDCKNSTFSDAAEEEIYKERENENDMDLRC